MKPLLIIFSLLMFFSSSFTRAENDSQSEFQEVEVVSKRRGKPKVEMSYDFYGEAHAKTRSHQEGDSDPHEQRKPGSGLSHIQAYIGDE